MSTTVPTDPADARRDALAGRLFGATLGAFDLYAVYLGLRLGLYRELADGGDGEGQGLTGAGLAARAGIAERYATEWLEHQAVGGLLDVVSPADATASERRYRLPAGHADVLLDPDNPSTMAPMARFVVAGAQGLPALAEAFRTGDGVAWADYGPELLEAQSLANRPVFRHDLAAWLSAVADVDARLRRPGARVADIACGTGWSSIAIARAYPTVEVEAIDLDPWSIEEARRNVAEAGLTGRVHAQLLDAADPSLAGRFDLALMVEALHDLSRPVEVLRAIRGLLAPGAAAIVVDENVAERFEAPGSDLDRIMYGYSVLFCLANGLAERPSAATGTVMRPDTVRRYATEAGFGSVTILPIAHEIFRLYRLDP